MIILISNILFISYWFIKLYGEVKNDLRKKIEKIYLFVCLWGNREKLEEEKKQREIQDQHDINMELFDIQLQNLAKLWSSNPK